ncbi:MAG: hypothetical protein K9J06_01270 [Flavobacteriales bacterium]|nr:hypothetical protein [Flavobacteriales bacterium]
MELLLAFLIAFGVVSSGDRATASLTQSQAEDLVKQNNLEKDFIIFGQEADDF